MPKELKGLPVHGYRPQNQDALAEVNEYKVIEEKLLRELERMKGDPKYDARCASIAFTGMQEAFMWMNRAVFKPGRVKLSEGE